MGTYKCGNCGKTLPDSSEFHRHSALSHGDKIPDLVKDPEAEAEYEGLKGLLEWNIQQELVEKKARAEMEISRSMAVSKMTARKSTTPDSRLGQVIGRAMWPRNPQGRGPSSGRRRGLMFP